MNKETTKKFETVEELQNEIEQNKNRVRELKRADSELRLQMAIKEIDGDMKAQRELLRACYDYIAQHRALFKKGDYGNHLD